MAGDWIKLHRKIVESAVASDAGVFHTWIMLLVKVNWKPGWFKMKRIEAGEMAFSWRSIGERLHGQFDDEGVLIVRPPSVMTMRSRLQKLQRHGMIKVRKVGREYSVVTICNWSTYQNDVLENSTPASTPTSTPLSTPPSTDIRKIRREEEIHSAREAGCVSPRFQRPTVEEVSTYCRERGNSVDPEQFVSYYDSNGWRVGKNPMKDWKAAVRTWEKNGRNHSSSDSGDEITNPYAVLDKRRKEEGW